MNDEERQLWRIGDLECVMISCCNGAELQLRQLPLSPSNGFGGTSQPDPADRGEIVLREMYPMKSDLYERARDLRQEYERAERP